MKYENQNDNQSVVRELDRTFTDQVDAGLEVWAVRRALERATVAYDDVRVRRFAGDDGWSVAIRLSPEVSRKEEVQAKLAELGLRAYAPNEAKAA